MMGEDSQKDSLNDEHREWYESNRSRFYQSMESQQALFDKTLILLCSGAVAGLVTMTLHLGATLGIKLSISLFLVALVSAMLSLVFSVCLHRDYCAQIDQNYKNKQCDKELHSAWESFVKKTNWITIFCAVMGTIGIIILVWTTSIIPQNQQQKGVTVMAEKNENKKPQPSTQADVVPVTEGFIPTQPSQPPSKPKPAPTTDKKK